MCATVHLLQVLQLIFAQFFVRFFDPKSRGFFRSKCLFDFLSFVNNSYVCCFRTITLTIDIPRLFIRHIFIIYSSLLYFSLFYFWPFYWQNCTRIDRLDNRNKDKFMDSRRARYWIFYHERLASHVGLFT